AAHRPQARRSPPALWPAPRNPWSAVQKTIHRREKIRCRGRILSARPLVVPMTWISGVFAMDGLTRPIIALHGVSNSILTTAIGDLTDQDAKTRSRGGTGPSIAWTTGHLCHYKIKVLE